jgi:O-antigen/teichoic acid export membrane protein
VGGESWVQSNPAADKMSSEPADHTSSDLPPVGVREYQPTASDVEFYFQEQGISRDTGQRALRGGIISIVGGYGNAALQLVASVVLARLLTPDDFGLVAIITALTSFAPILIDFGLADVTVQKSRITHGQVSSLFWISCGIGVAIAIAIAFGNPLIAWAYHDPRLKSIALISSLTFAISGMSGQHLSLLRRTLQFTTIAKIQFLGALAGMVVAIFVAYGGFGYWAIVIRPVVNAAVVAAGAWLACPWRPGRPTLDSEIGGMVRFGLHVVGFSVAYTISRALDRIGLGLFYAPRDVGYYQNAFTLYDNSIFSALSQVHTVGSAALSKLQSNPTVLSEKYESALSTLAFYIMPAAAILSVTAQDVVVIVLGQKWTQAGTLLSILALRGIVQVIEGSQGWLHLSLGRPDRWKNWGIVTAVLQVVAVACGLPFGTEGVAIAMVVASAMIALPSISYAGRPALIGTRRVIRATGRQMTGAILCAAAGWLLRTLALPHMDVLLRIIVSASFSTAVYLAIVPGLLRLTHPLALIGRLAHQQLLPRAAAWIGSGRGG